MSHVGPALSGDPGDRRRREKLFTDVAGRVVRSGLAGWHTTVRMTKTADTVRGSRRFVRFLRTGEAVSAIEYAVLVGVVVVGLTAALTAFQAEIEKALSRASALMTSTPGLTP